jgi:hypothetical protein
MLVCAAIHLGCKGNEGTKEPLTTGIAAITVNTGSALLDQSIRDVIGMYEEVNHPGDQLKIGNLVARPDYTPTNLTRRIPMR